MTPYFKAAMTALVVLVALASALVLTGCEQATVTYPEKDVQRYDDAANGVVCYHYRYSSSNLSCVKVQ